MIFPGLSRFSVPLLGAGQPPARAGPPPDSFRRVPQTDPEGKGPGGGIRVRVLINAAGTAHLQDLRRPAMSGAARPPAGSRPGSLFLRRHPKGPGPVTSSCPDPGGPSTLASLRACRARQRPNVASALAVGAQRSSSSGPKSRSFRAIAATTSITPQRCRG